MTKEMTVDAKLNSEFSSVLLAWRKHIGYFLPFKTRSAEKMKLQSEQ